MNIKISETIEKRLVLLAKNGSGLTAKRFVINLIKRGLKELEEESLRIDFVAFTRAENKLCIVTERVGDYFNPYVDITSLKVESIESFDFVEKNKRAYNLFVHKEYEKAKELLENDTSWIINYIQNHFANLSHLSFSKLNADPYSYLVSNILQVKDFSFYQIAKEIPLLRH